jgi:hypothetical protein
MKPQKVRKQPAKAADSAKIVAAAVPAAIVDPAEVCEASAD